MFILRQEPLDISGKVMKVIEQEKKCSSLMTFNKKNTVIITLSRDIAFTLSNGPLLVIKVNAAVWRSERRCPWGAAACTAGP